MKYIEEYDAKEQFDLMLDDVYGMVSIAGNEYETSYALKELDPLAYRLYFLDWLDSEELTTDIDEADEE